MLHHDQPAAVAAAIEAFLRRVDDAAASRASARGAAPTSRSCVLTLIWGSNWIVMKLALAHARPGRLQHRAHVGRDRRAVRGAARRSGGRCCRSRGAPSSVTGFFQTTINFGVDDDGARRRRRRPHVGARVHDAVLDAAARVAGARERVRGMQWIAIALAFAGLALVVEPWNWQGDLAPRLWAVLSGFGWAAGTVATKYFQRARGFDMLNFIAWQMLLGVLPLSLLPLAFAAAGDAMERDLRAAAALRRRGLDRVRLPAVDRGAALPARGHRVAQHVRDSGHRARCRRCWCSASACRPANGSASAASAPASSSCRCVPGSRPPRRAPPPEPMPLEGG